LFVKRLLGLIMWFRKHHTWTRAKILTPEVITYTYQCAYGSYWVSTSAPISFFLYVISIYSCYKINILVRWNGKSEIWYFAGLKWNIRSDAWAEKQTHLCRTRGNHTFIHAKAQKQKHFGVQCYCLFWDKIAIFSCVMKNNYLFIFSAVIILNDLHMIKFYFWGRRHLSISNPPLYTTKYEGCSKRFANAWLP